MIMRPGSQSTSRLERAMAFVAECMFCHLILRGVPDQRLGSSLECPRCRNCFTLAPTTNPLAETLPTSELVSKIAAPRPTAFAEERAAGQARSEERINR